MQLTNFGRNIVRQNLVSMMPFNKNGDRKGIGMKKLI
jgi:hypothetical protein